MCACVINIHFLKSETKLINILPNTNIQTKRRAN